MFLSKKKDDKKRPNVFIEIELRPRRGKSYPEYNFTDLVTEQKRKMVKHCIILKHIFTSNFREEVRIQMTKIQNLLIQMLQKLLKGWK